MIRGSRRVPSLPRYKGGTTRLEETQGSVNGAFSSALRIFSLHAFEYAFEEWFFLLHILLFFFFFYERGGPSLETRRETMQIISRGQRDVEPRYIRFDKNGPIFF